MSSSPLRKRETLTLTVPIPVFIPRTFAIDVLHDHSEVINLNPLVISHHQIPPPPSAPRDEYYNSIWYSITERIQYLPGLGKMGSGKISFEGCFRDTSDGLWTHIYAPMSVDLRAGYRVSAAGRGLALYADITFECNITLASFVRAQLKASIKEMVEKMITRAERLDADALSKMMGDQRMEEPISPIQEPAVQTRGTGMISKPTQMSVSVPLSPPLQPLYQASPPQPSYQVSPPTPATSSTYSYSSAYSDPQIGYASVAKAPVLAELPTLVEARPRVAENAAVELPDNNSISSRRSSYTAYPGSSHNSRPSSRNGDIPAALRAGRQNSNPRNSAYSAYAYIPSFEAEHQGPHIAELSGQPLQTRY